MSTKPDMQCRRFRKRRVILGRITDAISPRSGALLFHGETVLSLHRSCPPFHDLSFLCKAIVTFWSLRSLEQAVAGVLRRCEG
jgi:hypothetical protein